MRRTLFPFAAALLLLGCDSTEDKPGTGAQTLDEVADIAPPVPCPVGELLLTQSQVDADLALLELWNGYRLQGGACGGTQMDATNALFADEALMWTARCWAHDVSMNGAPAVDETFSDGTTTDQAAKDQGFAGILNGWGIQGGQPSGEAAFQDWIQDGDAGCERLWADATLAGTALSEAGDVSVVVRFSAIGPG